MRLLLLSFVLALLSPASSYANEGEHKVLSIPDYMSLFTVKIENKMASVFTPQLTGGHGTGFVVNGVKKNGEKFLHIFTNRHVVKAPSGYMQNVTVSFHADPSGTDIKAKVAYISDVHDFAILEVPVAEIEKHPIDVQGAPMPFSQHDPRTQAGQSLNKLEEMIRSAPMYFPGLKGAGTIAVGNPLNSNNIFTKGHVNGFTMSPEGPMIQTQTPINPGNSGGPLLMQTGPDKFVVIGINTAIILGAQNIGFSIPIGILMQEYQHWMNGAVIPRPKDYIPFTPVSPDQMKQYGYDDLIKKARPDDEGGPALQVASTTRNSPLKPNDILLTVEGNRINSMYEFKRGMLFTDYKEKKSLAIEVLRSGQLVKLDLPLAPLEFALARRELDFVYISGFVFQQMTGKLSAIIRPDIKSRVFVADIVPNPEMMFAPGMNMVPKQSLLQSIDIDGKSFEIESLLDLKNALKNTKPDSVILTHFYPAIMPEPSEDESPKSQQLRQPNYGDALIHRRLHNPEILTPRTLSLRQLKEQADLDPTADPKSRHWRNYVKTCDNALK